MAIALGTRTENKQADRSATSSDTEVPAQTGQTPLSFKVRAHDRRQAVSSSAATGTAPADVLASARPIELILISGYR